MDLSIVDRLLNAPSKTIHTFLRKLGKSDRWKSVVLKGLVTSVKLGELGRDVLQNTAHRRLREQIVKRCAHI